MAFDELGKTHSPRTHERQQRANDFSLHTQLINKNSKTLQSYKYNVHVKNAIKNIQFEMRHWFPYEIHTHTCTKSVYVHYW